MEKRAEGEAMPRKGAWEGGDSIYYVDRKRCVHMRMPCCPSWLHMHVVRAACLQRVDHVPPSGRYEEHVPGSEASDVESGVRNGGVPFQVYLIRADG